MPDQPPRVIIKGDLPLTREQEDRMIRLVDLWFAAIRQEMGWQGNGSYTGWMQNHLEDSHEYEGEFGHRENEERFGPLFRTFNFSENTPRAAALQSRARLAEQLLNTKPFATLQPEGDANKVPEIEPIDEHFDYKLRKAEAQQILRRALKSAGVVGEGIVKIACLTEPVEDKKRGQVWMQPDPQTGKVGVVKDEDGSPIWQDDAIEQHPTDVDLKVVQKNPAIILGPDAKLSDREITLTRQLNKRHLSLENIPWQDFFCGLTEPDIHSAQSIHQTQRWAWDKILKFCRQPGVKLTPEGEEYVENVRKGTWPEPDDSRAAQSHRKEAPVEQREGPGDRLYVESWFRFDPGDDGETIEAMMLWDLEAKFPLAYSTMKAASDTGSRPYGVERIIEPEDGRWYGISWYRWLRMEHMSIDRSRNRIEVRQGSGGLIVLFKPEKLPQILQGKPWRPGDGNPVEVDNDAKFDDVMRVEPLRPVDEGIWKLMVHDQQRVSTLTGSMMPAESQVSETGAKNNTATFVNQRANEGEMLGNDNLIDVAFGITAILKQAAIAIFTEFTDKDTNKLAYAEAAEHLGMQKAQSVLMWFQANPVEKLLHHLRLLLTKMRNKQQLQSTQLAWQLFAGGMSWCDLVAANPMMAKKGAAMMKAMLSSLDQQDVDEIVEIDDVIAAMQAQQEAEAIAQQRLKPSGQPPNVSPMAPPNQSAA